MKPMMQYLLEGFEIVWEDKVSTYPLRNPLSLGR